MVAFDRDKGKNLSNQKKHGISFKESQTVFIGENALLMHDMDHSDEGYIHSSWSKRKTSHLSGPSFALSVRHITIWYGSKEP
ncbi:MAG: BrnT family toxin [Deltaproteobacteria bacterium]|nr:BrnT family toxin [Deltaproteobacteria bacterium]